MARIPDATTLGTRNTPQSSRSIVGFDSKAGEGLQQAGRQLEQFGVSTARVADEKTQAQDKLETAQATLLYRQQLDAYQAKASESPDDYQNYSTGFEQVKKQALETARARITNKKLHGLFDVAAEELAMPYSSNMKKMATSVYADKTIAFATDAAEKEKLAQLSNPDPVRLGQTQILIKNAIEPLVASGAMDKTKADALVRGLNNSAQETYWDRRIQEDGVGTYKELSGIAKNAPLNVRNNNPGNIRGADGNFTKFETKEDGLAAMERDLLVKISGKSGAMKRNFGEGYKPTIRNIITTWAPATENDTGAYVATVARESGIDPDAPLSPSDAKKIMGPMIKVEGGSNSMAYFKPDADIVLNKMAQAKSYAAVGVRDEMKRFDEATKFTTLIPQDQISDLAARALDLNMPEEHKKIVEFGEVQKLVSDFVPMPMAEQQAAISADLEAVRGGDLARVPALEAKKTFYDNKLKMLKSDPWSFLQANGMMTQTGKSLLDGDPDVVFARRMDIDRAAPAVGGMEIALITDTEAAQLKEQYDSGKDVGGTLVKMAAMMNGNERRATARKIFEKDKVLAAAMSVDPSTASKILSGNRGKGFVTEAKFQSTISEKLKGVVMTSEANDDIMAATYAYYKQRAIEKQDVNTEPTEALVDEAISKVVGNVEPVSIFGNASRIILPANTSSYQFQDKVSRITPADLQAMGGARNGFNEPMTPQALLEGNRLVSAGAGRYNMVNTKTGEPVLNGMGVRLIIDFEKISRPTGPDIRPADLRIPQIVL